MVACAHRVALAVLRGGQAASAESCTHPAKRDHRFSPPIAERQRLPNVRNSRGRRHFQRYFVDRKYHTLHPSNHASKFLMIRWDTRTSYQIQIYRQTFNIRRSLVGNKLADHSDYNIFHTAHQWLGDYINQEFVPTKHTPYIALAGESWGVCWMDFLAKWPRYNGTVLAYVNHTCSTVRL